MSRIRGRLAASLAPLGARSALSNRVPLFFFPVAFASQVSADAAKNGGHIALWAATGLVGFGALFVGFVLARRVLGEHADPGLARVFAVFALVGVARSLTVGLLAVGLGVLPQLDIAYRLAGGIVYAPALLAVVAYAVSRHDAHAALVSELEGRRAALLVVEQDLDRARARAEDQLVVAVRASIDPALQAFDVALEEAAARKRPSTALAALTHLIDGEVRPLSHRLASETPDPPTFDDLPPAAGAAHVPLPLRFPPAAGIRPLIAALLFTAAATPSALRDLEPAGVAAYLCAIPVIVVSALLVLRRILRPLVLPTRLAVALVVVVHGVLGFAILPLLEAAGIVTPEGIQLTGTVITALIGAMTIATPLVDAGRSGTEAELTLTVEQLQRSVERMRRRRWLAQRRLAHVLHGSLQGTLYAAAMELAESSEPVQGTIDGIRERIGMAVERLNSDGAAGESTPLSSTLEELLGTWGERRHVRIAIDADTEEVLATDRDAEEAVALVVREAVVNAMRHGRAQEVDVAVTLAGGVSGSSPRIEVVVRDDGVGWTEESSRGLGSALFTELCAEWGYVAGGDGTVFTGNVATS